MKAFFVALFAWLRATPVCEALSPSTAEERIAAARRQTAERAVDDLKALRLHHGLKEIRHAKADNLAYFADRYKGPQAFTFRAKK